MTTVLHGWTWVGDDEPTTGVLATQGWIKPTTGEEFRRNTSNTAWIVFGNVNSRLGGAVEVAGSTVTGPILGAPNLPPLTDPDFLGDIRQEGFKVALETSLAALEKRLYDRVSSQVREQFLSQTKRSGTSSNIAYHTESVETTVGVLLAGIAIALPVFSDGVTATSDQVVGYSYAMAGWVTGDLNVSGDAKKFWLAEDTPGSRIIKGHYVGGAVQPGNSEPCFVMTSIFAMR